MIGRARDGLVRFVPIAKRIGTAVAEIGHRDALRHGPRLGPQPFGVRMGGIHNRTDLPIPHEAFHRRRVEFPAPPVNTRMDTHVQGRLRGRRDQDLESRASKPLGDRRRFAGAAQKQNHTVYPRAVTNHLPISLDELFPTMTMVCISIAKSSRRSRSVTTIRSVPVPTAVAIPTGVAGGRCRRKMATASSSWATRSRLRGL